MKFLIIFFLFYLKKLLKALMKILPTREESGINPFFIIKFNFEKKNFIL